ncbi:hypothetical protein [Flammeovirga sp. OC4]|uniref:hypothetical protein n=1 Tax=Flammeovirga sp. OC4 TaxID=1382345 RepID=UPI000694782D|nr:hypothetical protein [Flammeovirga sp. OC4]
MGTDSLLKLITFIIINWSELSGSTLQKYIFYLNEQQMINRVIILIFCMLTQSVDAQTKNNYIYTGLIKNDSLIYNRSISDHSFEIDPTGIAIQFINDYVENCNSKEKVEITNWVNNYPEVSLRFKEELKQLILEAEQNEPEIGLGFDPIFDAQDYPEEGFKLFSFDSTTNYLTVEGIHWEGFYVTMKIKKYNDNWRVEGCGIINIPKSKQAKR